MSVYLTETSKIQITEIIIDTCRYNNRDLHEILKRIHTGDPKKYTIRGPSSLKDKEI